MAASPMNVVLAHPQWFTQRPIQPMGLLYLASVLRRAGHRVRIIDGEVERIGHDAMAEIVAAERPDLFGITSTTAQATRAFALAEAVKRRVPGTLVVLGGPHTSSLPERSLQEAPSLDAVGLGVTTAYPGTDLDDDQIRRLFHKAMREAVLYNPKLLLRRLSHLASVRHLGQSVRAAVRLFTS